MHAAVSLCPSLRFVLLKGGFNLTKGTSTSHDALYSNPNDHRGISPDDTKSKQLQQRVRGVIWGSSTYQLRFDPVKLNELTTQRNLLRVTSFNFDPLGIAAPITIRLRIIHSFL